MFVLEKAGAVAELKIKLPMPNKTFNCVILKTFLGKLAPPPKTKQRENYWKLIGEKGHIINDVENDYGRVLVLFEKDLDDFALENHNPIKNSLWVKRSDLEIDVG